MPKAPLLTQSKTAADIPCSPKIRRRFGDRVAHIVEGCTDSYGDPKPPWKQRKLDYLEHLSHDDDDTRLVSAADKRHNARTILADLRLQGDAVFGRIRRRP